jgi:orotate phosphoribosyltransferase
MHLVPTNEEVLEILEKSGGIRRGHFEYPNGLHGDQYLQPAMAMRRYQTAKLLSVGLSRLVRANAEIRAEIPKLSIVTPATGGLPVAYGIGEALRAHQVYWAESSSATEPLRFRMFLEVEPGEKVLLVDDVLRSGRRMTQLKRLVEEKGGEVVGIAVLVVDRQPGSAKFDSLPLYFLAETTGNYYSSPDQCPLCRDKVPVLKVWV